MSLGGGRRLRFLCASQSQKTTPKPQNGSLGLLKIDAVHKRQPYVARALQNTAGDTLHWTVADLASTFQASIMQLQIPRTYTRKPAAAKTETHRLDSQRGNDLVWNRTAKVCFTAPLQKHKLQRATKSHLGARIFFFPIRIFLRCQAAGCQG